MLEGCDSQIAWEFKGMCELWSLETVLDCWIVWNRICSTDCVVLVSAGFCITFPPGLAKAIGLFVSSLRLFVCQIRIRSNFLQI